MSFIVARDGLAAVRGIGWAAKPTETPTPALLRWDTYAGALKFSSMNGGKVTTELEFFYSPRLTG